MICAGKGARVIANIWNGSLDKRNICTILRERDRQRSRRERVKGSSRKKWKKGKAHKPVGVCISLNH